MSLQVIRKRLEAAERKFSRQTGTTKLIAVSKVQPNERVRAVLAEGHRVFGENRVQEALGKWPAFKKEFDGIELHLIGPSQKLRRIMGFLDYRWACLAILNRRSPMGRHISGLGRLFLGNASLGAHNNFCATAYTFYDLPQVLGIKCDTALRWMTRVAPSV